MRILEDDLKRYMIATTGLGASLLFFSLYLRDVELDSLFLSRGEPIGYIEKYELDVTRRPRARLLWIPVLSTGQVFEKDTIRTGRDSSVVINLGTKGRVELRPDSLAVLETQGDSFRINLASGDLFVKGDVVAKIGDTEVKSKGASFGVTRDSISGQFKVESQKGNLELSKAGQTSSLKEGSQFIESQDGQSQTIKIPVARLSPADGSEIKVGDALQPISFGLGWIQESAALQYQNLKSVRVEFSKDRSFKSIVKAVDLDVSSLSSAKMQSVSLGTDGAFFWRVKDSSTQALLSSTGRFTSRAPSQWMWANNSKDDQGLEVLAELGDSGLSLDLDWVGPKEARVHDLKFKVKSKIVAQTQTGPLQRVRFSQINASWVQSLKKLSSQELSDLRLELTAMSASQSALVEKPLVATIMLSDARGLPPLTNLKSEVQEDLRRVKLSWTPAQGEGFESELSVSDKIERHKNSEVTLDSEAVLQAFEQGKLKVRVRAQDGRLGKWQDFTIATEQLKDAVSIKSPVTLLTPSPQKVLLAQPTETVEFRWSTVGSARWTPLAYRLQVKSNDGTLVKREVKDARSTIEVPKAGRYTWTVQALWPGGVEGPNSEERTFEIVRKTLRAPSIRAPATVK